ncbi:hypothetical protein ACFPRL_18380 [Pseudoclavibacter helvolus]
MRPRSRTATFGVVCADAEAPWSLWIVSAMFETRFWLRTRERASSRPGRS